MTAPNDTARRTSVEQVLAIVSAVLIPLGLAVMLLGWFGAAHTPYLFEQVPYLISGGIIGLGLSVVGGLVYFGSWVARSSAQQQKKNDEMTEILREIREELRHRDVAAAPAPVRRTSSANGAKPFVATQRGGMLHRPDCAVVAGRTDLKAVSASGDGLSPCTLCNPLDVDVLTH
ncbi:MAG: hypothetical protein JWO22_3035 [Frankiales bacterium]|nr:hypothetical protein [Frankiales bacterium]